MRPRESRQVAQGSSAVYWLFLLPQAAVIGCYLVSCLLSSLRGPCLSRPILSRAASPVTFLPSPGLLHSCEWRASAPTMPCVPGMLMNELVWGSPFLTTQEWSTLHQQSKENGTAVIEILTWAWLYTILFNIHFHFAPWHDFKEGKHAEFGVRGVHKKRQRREWTTNRVKLLTLLTWGRRWSWNYLNPSVLTSGTNALCTRNTWRVGESSLSGSTRKFLIQ